MNDFLGERLNKTIDTYFTFSGINAVGVLLFLVMPASIIAAYVLCCQPKEESGGYTSMR